MMVRMGAWPRRTGASCTRACVSAAGVLLRVMAQVPPDMAGALQGQVLTSDHVAGKMARNEVRHANFAAGQLLASGAGSRAGLHIPLIATVDYRGHRVLAMPLVRVSGVRARAPLARVGGACADNARAQDSSPRSEAATGAARELLLSLASNAAALAQRTSASGLAGAAPLRVGRSACGHCRSRRACAPLRSASQRGRRVGGHQDERRDAAAARQVLPAAGSAIVATASAAHRVRAGSAWPAPASSCARTPTCCSTSRPCARTAATARCRRRSASVCARSCGVPARRRGSWRVRGRTCRPTG